MTATPRVFAHRGGRVWAPENTLAAFRMSLEAGVYGIELDVHRCKSGELVVIHDPTLSATTNGAGQVGDIDLEELRQFSAGIKFGAQFASEKIPLLSEVLELVDGKAILNIEVKNAPRQYPGIEADLLRELRSYPHPETVVISSFDHELLSRIHALDSRYSLAILVRRRLKDVAGYAESVGANYVHPKFVNLAAKHVRVAHAGFLKVNAWTLNTVEEWQSGVEMHLDGIVTDDPAGCLNFLTRLVGSARPGGSVSSWWQRFCRRVKFYVRGIRHSR